MRESTHEQANDKTNMGWLGVPWSSGPGSRMPLHEQCLRQQHGCGSARHQQWQCEHAHKCMPARKHALSSCPGHPAPNTREGSDCKLLSHEWLGCWLAAPPWNQRFFSLLAHGCPQQPCMHACCLLMPPVVSMPLVPGAPDCRALTCMHTGPPPPTLNPGSQGPLPPRRGIPHRGTCIQTRRNTSRYVPCSTAPDSLSCSSSHGDEA